ncbi:DoxX-like family protein [Thiobacillus sp.]|uniref:DoxX-like family protein n=1 Tax=Thiobacillus sp. TaxID=924 RepID=UPI00341714A1
MGLQGPISEATLYAAALLDIVLGVLTITRPSKRLWKAQAVLILIYTVIISVRLPEFWLHPFGPVLKNLPIFMILWLLHRHQGTQP